MGDNTFDSIDSRAVARKLCEAALANCMKWSHRENTLFQSKLFLTRDGGLERTIWFRLIRRWMGAKDVEFVTPRVENDVPCSGVDSLPTTVRLAKPGSWPDGGGSQMELG